MSHISTLQIGSEYSLFATQNLQEVRKCIFWLICPDLAIMGIYDAFDADGAMVPYYLIAVVISKKSA